MKHRTINMFGLCTTAMATSVALAGGITINEVRVNVPGDDDLGEYFELAGAPGASLDGLSYIVIGDDSMNGSGVIEAVVDLTGNSIPLSGLFVGAESVFDPALGTADAVFSLNFENNDVVTHLLVSGFAGSDGQDLDTNDDGTLDLTPWAAIIDDVALVGPEGGPNLAYSATQVGPDGPFVTAQAFRCTPDGTFLVGAFDLMVTDTPGGANLSCADLDMDGIIDALDNCPLPNPDQLDCDMNGIGDVCDIDSNPSLDVSPMDGVIDLCQTITDLSINEILYDPAPDASGDANQDTVSDTSDDEFVEIVNTTGAAIDMSDYRIADGFSVRHIFPAGTVLDAGCAIVVFGGGNPPINNFGGAIVQTASSGSLGLNNGGDTVTLLLPDEVTVLATVSYDGSVENESINRSPELTGLYIGQTGVAGAVGIQSPGVRVDGSEWVMGGCIAPLPDMDGDGHPDAFDNCPLFNPAQLDCNNNGVGDACDLDITDPDGNGETSTDCDANGVPDECQPDCNGNLVADACDIANMTSLDCNMDGVPDDCIDPENDCNTNGVPDECDIADMTSTDANMNGLPDECEAANPGIFINEIHANVDSGNNDDTNNDGVSNESDDEYVELVNNSGGSLDITGWTLGDAANDNRHVFPVGSVVDDGCGIVIFGGGTAVGQFGGSVAQIASSGGLGLSNGGETVTLRNDMGEIVTQATIGGSGQAVSYVLSPEIIGVMYVTETIIGGSAGTFSDGTPFPGCAATAPDMDMDGIPDAEDNCPMDANPQQEDCDLDGIGDACDTDPDANMNGIQDNCEVAAPAGLVINEVRIDQPGSDVDEYIELSGLPGTSLQGLTFIAISDPPSGFNDGAGGAIDNIIPLTVNTGAPLTVPADGLFLITADTFTLAGDIDAVRTLAFENGDTVTFLLVTNFTGAIGDDIDLDDDALIDANPPWGEIVDGVSLLSCAAEPCENLSYAAGEGFPVVPAQTITAGKTQFEVVAAHAYRCSNDPSQFVGGEFDPFSIDSNDTPASANDSCVVSTPCPWDCAPDNGDGTFGNGVINIDDLLGVINSFGQPGGPCDNAPDNGDGTFGNGIINIDDILGIINNFGVCPL
ncbi:MAG: lamin tail domain-containing protein [Planctomycetota bacterium]